MTDKRMFRQGKIGALQVRNRIVMPAMATNFASAHGEPTPQMIAYYAARADGGAGLIVIENASIDEPAGGNGTVQLRIDHDRYVPGLFGLARAVRTHGAAVAIQINHAGAVADPQRTGVPAVAPSNVGWTANALRPVPLEVSEIEVLIECYARAAVRAKRAGFDAVEIHGAHGYLIAQFLSPITNRRTDAFGGGREKRWRFALDVVRRVRQAVGCDYPLLFRLSGDEFLPGGRTLDESVELCHALVDAGIDALHITAATAANPEKQLEPMSYPEAWRAYLAETIRAAVDIPVVTVGVFRNPETVERALAEETADFVAIGRGLIADPRWPDKAVAGKDSTIRRCISCNRCIQRRVFDDLPICCSVNPEVGFEAEAHPETCSGRRVVVVGAGPGGLQAAATAAIAGAQVVLLEREAELGGQLRFAKVPPHKEKIDWLLEDMVQSLPVSVEIKTGIDVTVETVRELRPDAVILAIGGIRKLLTATGGSREHVWTVERVLSSGDAISGEVVVVIGGGMVGCETASYCAERGSQVTVLELLNDVGQDCEPISRRALLRHLEEQHVRIRTGVRVIEIRSDTVVIEENGQQSELPATRVVVAIGAESNLALANELKDDPFRVFVVGDARDPRGVQEAVYEGWRAAWRAVTRTEDGTDG